jgi:hypothetical protein
MNKENHPNWGSYRGMKQRCYDPNNERFKNYGKRGIKVCDRWLGVNGFENFCKDMGTKPHKNYSIERISNSRDYEPGNCKWETNRGQSLNRRNNVKTWFRGEEKVYRKF